jgi:uncharacterized protein VirK/YbjX
MQENRNEAKERVVAWLYPEMIANMETLMQVNNMKNHTEFVSQAVDFYIGFLNSQTATAFLSKNLLDAIKGTLQITENRMASNLFRLSVEISMMMHLMATTLNITDEELRRLRGDALPRSKKPGAGFAWTTRLISRAAR